MSTHQNYNTRLNVKKLWPGSWNAILNFSKCSRVTKVHPAVSENGPPGLPKTKKIMRHFQVQSHFCWTISGIRCVAWRRKVRLLYRHSKTRKFIAVWDKQRPISDGRHLAKARSIDDVDNPRRKALVDDGIRTAVQTTVVLLRRPAESCVLCRDPSD